MCTVIFSTCGFSGFNLFKRRSDIDILVDFEEGADLFDLVGLSLFLERILKQKVDVVPKRALREEIKESVLKEVVSL